MHLFGGTLSDMLRELLPECELTADRRMASKTRAPSKRRANWNGSDRPVSIAKNAFELARSQLRAGIRRSRKPRNFFVRH